MSVTLSLTAISSQVIRRPGILSGSVIRISSLECGVRTVDFDYPLPPELIAQQPAAQRDLSRLLVLQRPKGHVTHREFRDLVDYLRAGDVLVLNDSRVIPARLRALKAGSGGEVE